MAQEEERVGVSLDVIRKVLDENRALVRLLAGATASHDVSGAELGANVGAEAESPSVLISTYHEVLELLEIMSATSGAWTGSQCIEAEDSEGGDLE